MEMEKRSNTMAAQVELPEECWELIIKMAVDGESEWADVFKKSHLGLLSLVCKRFLSISDRLLFTLRLYHSNPATKQILPRLLRRFKRLKRIELSHYRGDLESIVAQIAVSASAGCCAELDSLQISSSSTLSAVGFRALGRSQMMKTNLKTLSCTDMGLEDSHLNVIADSFASLEDLDISCWEKDESTHVSDMGILSLSLKLKSLKTIRISGNHLITDQSLEFLSTNCLLLSQLDIGSCPSISLTGISKLIHGCPSLNSISLRGKFKPLLPDSLIISGPPKALSVIDISGSVISDEFLYQVAQARLPLKKLSLFLCTDFSFSGISYLLNQYPSLEHLHLTGTHFLTDTRMVVLSKFLRSIKYIDLVLCRELTSNTFFSLLRNCPILNEIQMVGTNVGKENCESNCNVTSGVKFINLDRVGANNSMCNDFLKTLASTCPKLECLSLRSCDEGAQEGILEVLKRCSEITRLMLDDGKVTNNVFMHLEFDLPMLKELSLRSTGIDDDAAAMIGKRCLRLLKLDLYGCLSLTSKGVKAVVNNCKELMEIKLDGCDKVSVDIIPWMVISRPSLKTIVAPLGFKPTESQSNLFWRHGCRLIPW